MLGLKMYTYAISLIVLCAANSVQTAQTYEPLIVNLPIAVEIENEIKAEKDDEVNIGDDNVAKQEMQLSVEQRSWFRNPDGSCVQCSIGMCGVHTNTPEATTLLWDTEYGPKVRGGSGPSRVAGYMNTRKIKGWNITGRQTYDWMKWSCKTGRFAAIGAGGSHFQTLYGYNPEKNIYYVCNNNSPQRIDEYNENQFHNLHEASGEWCVILEKSNCKNPEYKDWWSEN